MTTMRHPDLARLSTPRQPRRALLPARRPARSARRHLLLRSAVSPRAGARRMTAQIFSIGRDLLCALWALAALGFSLVVVIALLGV